MAARLLPSPLHRFDFEHDACGVGFIAQISGARSHEIILRALAALKNLAHRGAIDADAITGDRAGILTQIPTALLQNFLAENGQSLARAEDLAVAMCFFPRENSPDESALRQIVEEAVAAQRLTFLCWRNVPVNALCLGRKALETQPLILQALVRRAENFSHDDFDRRMFFVQKIAELRAREKAIPGFYVCSSLSRTIVYKGLFNAPQLRRFYTDLKSPDFTPPPSRFFTSATRRTPFRPGRSRILFACSRTTARSTPFARIATSCPRASVTICRNFGAMKAKICRLFSIPPAAIQLHSITRSSFSLAPAGRLFTPPP